MKCMSPSAPNVVGGPLVDLLSARTVLVLAGAGGVSTFETAVSLARRTTATDF